MRWAAIAICVCAIWAAPTRQSLAYQTGESPSAAPTSENAQVESNTFTRTAGGHVAIKLFGSSSADPDCHSVGFPKVTVIDLPSHGAIIIKKEPLYPNYRPTSTHYKCNFIQTIGVNVYYKTNQTISGSDKVVIRQAFPNGRIIDSTYNINIKDETIAENSLDQQNGEIPLEIPTATPIDRITNKTVFANRDNGIFVSYGINPDCSSIGFSLLAIIEPPAHGTTRIEPEEPYAVFPEGHGYFKCNGTKLNDVRIYYKPEDGYIGPDKFVIKGKMGSGREFRQSFVLTVQ